MEQSKADSDATGFDRLTGTIPLTPATAIHVARAHLRNTVSRPRWSFDPTAPSAS